jgi:histone-lysine N-methyltransferase SETD3
MMNEEEEMLYKEYTEWIISEGAVLDKVALKYFYTDYRGLIANSHIGKEGEVLFIPEKAMITLKMARDSAIGVKLKSGDANLIYPNNSTLATFVLSEMVNPGSVWTLFLKALPKSVSSFPIFFTEEERKLLTGSLFLKAIDELKEDMQWDYDEICRCAPEFEDIAKLEDFMKVRALVNSRIFGIKVNNEENDALVPYADMFNFKYQSDMTSWTYSDERRGFVVKAKEDIKKGEEIYVFYGSKPNWSFFQFYGFVLENNENDEVILEVELFYTDPLKNLKEELMDKKQQPKKLKLKETTDINKFSKAISYMRYMTFDGSEEELIEVNL